LFLAFLETETRTLKYVNAGHNSQFVLRNDGAVERLVSTGRPLGLLPGGGYSCSRILLGDGDSLFFYTDGLVETENADGEEFGMNRLEALLQSERSAGLDVMLALVEKAASDYRGPVEAADDATMVLVRITVRV
jgi:sigma-B regulation protein RsbU (phosphoserine phosphatase)